MFTLSVILIADLFGLVPKRNVMQLELRQKICESLAVQLSVAASHSQYDIVNTSLEIFVSRNQDVVAAAMKKIDGETVTKFGNFTRFSAFSKEKTSDEDMIIVPIYAGEKQWGSVYVEFESLYSSGLFSILMDSIFGILLFVALFSFIGYMFILKKSLSVLDPKSVMPDRVCAAFNSLSEGVMIIDNKEDIIMANTAFAKKVDHTPEELLGVNISSMKWKHMNREQRQLNDDMPWKYAINDGVKKLGVALNLSAGKEGARLLSTNCSPIRDDSGNTRGALVTFDDVTDIEETNLLLENAVTTLRKSEMEIKHKNDELEVLATRDSLTGCYNRRAFYDLFIKAIEVAEKNHKSISVLMVDIDFFKSINDRFGHAVGDEAICLVADVLNNHCDNEGVIVGRYGGEEFCVALPGSDTEDAFNIAEKLRKAIQTTSHNLYEKGYSITASFGLVCNDGQGDSCSEMLDFADKALYIAKESGRNKVIIWRNDEASSDVDSGDAVVEDKLKNIHDNGDAGSSTDAEKILLLRNKVAVLQNELSEYNNSNEVETIDPVTRLPSTFIFKDRVNQAIAYSIRNKKLISIATLNIDMFSRINETMGESAGDDFLRAAGNRLKDILRDSDTVALLTLSGNISPSLSRLRNDEFVLLLTGLENAEALTNIIQRIQEKFKGKIEIAGNDLYVTTSIGLSVYPQDGETPEVLMENSGRAQKQAKKLPGRSNFLFYSPEVNRMVVDQMQAEIELHDAIEQKQFILYYQPKLDLKTETIVSMEALIRWEHPDKGMVYPDDFIPTAEKTGMILEIGDWCLHTACKQAKKWVDMGVSGLRVSVNISALEFANDGFKDKVLHALKESGLSPNNLDLEITESTILADQKSANTLIDELHTLGITLTLDDFGSGYSSLSCFGHLEMDCLKLDKTFLEDAMVNNRSRMIYSGVVKMVRDTGVRVVVEGVETDEEYTYIRSLEVDEMQGYILSEPVNVESMTNLLFPDVVKHKKKM